MGKIVRTKSLIDSILIANRGEIACRIIRTAKEMGIRTVCVYSDIDVDSLHVKMADESYRLGGKTSIETYLNQNKILDIATSSKCKAVHPGYGFLSENAEFANLCEANNVIFVGPSSEAIRSMGIKSTSKEIMTKANVPVIPGYHGNNQDDATLSKEADNIGFPLMIKAVQGGGGKGMRIVKDSNSFLSLLNSAKRESQSSFNDSTVLLEKFIESPRHIEVQIIADQYDNYVYLYERDCSVQRRHQKIIEEAPAPGISHEFRHILGENAVKVAKAVKYRNAGTVEFIMDRNTKDFYFMEMNTRLQVEHPISEMITNVDLVQWQIMVASGEEIPLKQNEIKLKGHAFETRIYAENPYDNFLPGAGNLTHLSTPELSSNLRIETGVVEGDEVSVHYDPMISKLVVWDENRKAALARMRKALSQYQIAGLDTNINFLIGLCKNEHFINEDFHTGFIAEHKDELLTREVPDTDIILQTGLAIILKEIYDRRKSTELNRKRNVFSILNGFRLNHYYTRNILLKYMEKDFVVEITYGKDNSYILKLNEETSTILNAKNIQIEHRSKYGFTIIFDGDTKKYKCQFVYLDDSIHAFTEDGSFKFNLPVTSYDIDPEENTVGDKNRIFSPMPGMVDKVLVQKGDSVKVGDPIMVIIAMKMEYVLTAPSSGIIEDIFYKSGDSVKKNENLVKLTPV